MRLPEYSLSIWEEKMTTAEIILLILGMAFVTYIPRAIPAAFIDKIRFGKKLEKFLMLIPYTAMTALIVPGIFSSMMEMYLLESQGFL